MRFPTSARPATPRMAEAAEKGIEIYREAIQPLVDEPVLAACPFARQGMMTDKLAGQFGALPYALARKRQKSRAGGLPEHFIVAVTAERVYAFERKVKGRDPIGQVGGEVGRWERAALRVSSRSDRSAGGMLLNVKIESPAAGEAVNCSVGRSAESEEFLALLADPAAVA
jgi:hypothetical protein